MTRKELNSIVENYLFEEQLNEARREGVTADIYIAQCNFDFQPEFLEIIEFIKAGGEIPRAPGSSEGKPDFFNPLFLDAFKQQVLPFVNMLVAPQFGIKTKCDTLMELQAMFNKMYSKFSSGYARQTRTQTLSPEEKKKRQEEIETKIPGVHREYFDDFKPMLRKNNIILTKERYSRLVDNPPSGLTNEEMIYASMILGNLEEATGTNRRDVSKILDNFENPGRVNTFKDLLLLCEPTKNIPGYDKVGLETLFSATASRFSRDPTGGAQDMLLVTELVFEKLKSAGIL